MRQQRQGHSLLKRCCAIGDVKAAQLCRRDKFNRPVGFVLQQNPITRHALIQYGIGGGHVDCAVCAGMQQNLVFALIIDTDDGVTGRGVGFLHMRNIHAR